MATTITRLGNIRSSMRNHWLTNLDRAEIALKKHVQWAPGKMPWIVDVEFECSSATRTSRSTWRAT